MRLDLGGVDGDRLYIVGDDLGDGPAVVLVHGWPGSSVVWDDLRALLLAAGYRVVTYDRRGFGRSGRPSTGYDLDTLAEDLGRVLALRDLEDATVVGWDLGCAEVIRLLGSTGETRVGRMVLIAPLWRERAHLCQLGQALAVDRFGALERDTKLAFRCDGRLDRSAARRAWWTDGCTTAAHALGASLHAYMSDLGDDCTRLSLPTLIVSSAGQGSQYAALATIPLASWHSVAAGSPAVLPTHGAELGQILLDYLALQT